MTSMIRLRVAFIWIFLSVLVFSGPCYLGFFLYRKAYKVKCTDDKYNIVEILQPEMENKLSLDYIARLMSLSCDKPTNIFLFDVKKAREDLLKSPFIKDAKVKKVGRGGIYVEYVLRTPIAVAADWDNAAIDENGVIFPLNPFFSNDGLLEVRLNFENTDICWGKSVKDMEAFSLAMNIFELLNTEQFVKAIKIVRIDVSRAFVKSFGKREAVVICEEVILLNGREFVFPKILRLDPQNYEKQLYNLVGLLDNMGKDYEKQLEGFKGSSSVVRFASTVIDLRIDKLAFIDENN
jgi:hypothetical protein